MKVHGSHAASESSKPSVFHPRRQASLSLHASTRPVGRRCRGAPKCFAASHAGRAVAAAATANVAPAAIPQCLPPAAAFAKVVALGSDKAELTVSKTFILSLLAGVYISFGGMLAISVGGACAGLAQSNPGLQKLVLGLVGLPTGLLMVLVCGGELFTGNTALLTAAWCERQASMGQVFKNWVVSYVGNFVGSLFMVQMVVLTGIFAAAPAAVKIAAAKTSLTFLQAFTRGVLANWLVCIAIWQASASASLPGKAVGVLLPISAFVAMGLEHSVANMFMVPLGIACGGGITFSHFLASNLLPVTMGNIVGGVFCVALPYALVYGRKGAH